MLTSTHVTISPGSASILTSACLVGCLMWGITPQFGGLGWRDFGCDLFSSGVEAGLPGECADLISDVVMSGKNGSFGAAVGVPREGVKLDCACYPAT